MPSGMARQRAQPSGPGVGAERNPATAPVFLVNPLHMQACDGLFSINASNTAAGGSAIRSRISAVPVSVSAKAADPPTTAAAARIAGVRKCDFT